MREKIIIEVDDIVMVSFNNSQFTLCKEAKVLGIPCATGDSWKFLDLDTLQVHYVSEGCTITLIEKAQNLF